MLEFTTETAIDGMAEIFAIGKYNPYCIVGDLWIGGAVGGFSLEGAITVVDFVLGTVQERLFKRLSVGLHDKQFFVVETNVLTATICLY
jgi:hypothetical protein